ncbi:MAG: hypothetical protein H0U49_12600 [Parachlamydiaceae bacterium]|nr:hypothetical protein [Parachlamydiaceae bacterium]
MQALEFQQNTYLDYLVYHNYHWMQNSQIIAGAQATANEIIKSKSIFYGKGTDFVEREFDRTSMRLMGVAAEAFAYYITGRICNLSLLCDILADSSKIKLLNNKISSFTNVQVHTGTTCDLMASNAQKTEIKIYENLLNYTNTAKRIKRFAFMSSGAAIFLGLHNLDQSIKIVGSAALFIHWLAAGSKVEGINETLAFGLLNPIL